MWRGMLAYTGHEARQADGDLLEQIIMNPMTLSFHSCSLLLRVYTCTHASKIRIRKSVSSVVTLQAACISMK